MFRPGIKTILLAIVLEFVITIGALILMGAQKVESAEPVRSYEMWHDDALILYKVQDGDCTLYIARGYVGVVGKFASPAMVAGHGCRQ